MKRNKLMGMCMVLTMCGGMFVGCGNSGNQVAAGSNEDTTTLDQLSIVCTTFPQYDWVQEILGDKADQYDLTLLLDDGVDLHSYQPTAEDIAKISGCDVFIYVGGESDGWVDDALKEATNKEMQVINMLEVLGDSVKEEELVEGMQGHDHEHEHEEGEEAHEHEHEEGEEAHDHEHEEEAHDHEHEEGEEAHTHHHEHGEGPEYDEHVWLSLKNAQVLTEQIEKALAKVDSENASVYEANAKAYGEQLAKLDADYQAAIDGAGQKTVLFGDRFPFRYMVDDYGIEYYAAFVGCSAETEASFETITFLSGKVDELSLPAVLVIDNSDQKIAKAIIENTTSKNQAILEMDSMQSVTDKEVADGYSYLKAMEGNLETLKQALK